MKLLKNKNWSCRILAVGSMLAFINLGFIAPERPEEAIANSPAITTNINANSAVYESLELNSLGLSREAFDFALAGYTHLLNAGKIKKDNLLSILDFSLPSGKKRLFVIDLISGELVFHTYAAHGRNSGTDIATKFSNNNNSYQSSLGFYVTGDTYIGKHGSSLRLEGEEEGINDNAMARGIVMHSAAYVDESIIAQQGYIGRSQGCPALAGNIYKEVIEKIKNGSCLFLYSPDKYYVAHSKILRERV